MIPALRQPAAKGILELVCGYPAPQQWRQPIVVLKAYIDDSLKDDVLVMGGYIATAEAWADFSVEWGRRLAEAQIDEFKMSKRVNEPVEFNGYFYRAIEDYAQAAICVAIPIGDLCKAVDSLGLPKVMKNPYNICVKAVVNCCAQLQEELGIS